MTETTSRGPSAFRDLLDREPGLFAVAALALGFDLSMGVLGRYLPAYLTDLGAGPTVVGLVWSVWLLARVAYPYLGGALAAVRRDGVASAAPKNGLLSAVRSRELLTESAARYVTAGFGLVATLGYLLWVAAPQLGPVAPLWFSVGPWLWTLAGVACLETWRSYGPGVTFAEWTRPTQGFAARLAAVRTFRRVGVLLGLVVLVAVFVAVPAFRPAFQSVTAVAASLGVAATVGRLVLSPTEENGEAKGGATAATEVGSPVREPPSLGRVRDDLWTLSSSERTLVLADALARFARGLFYPFLVLAVADFGVAVPDAGFGAAATFAVLLAVETVVALLAAIPTTRLADRVGAEAVVGSGRLAAALFPLAFAAAPPNPLAAAALFGGFGAALAARPTRRELLLRVVRERGEDVSESVRLVTRGLAVPSALVGGVCYGLSPTFAFGLATSVGLLGCWEFLRWGWLAR